MTNKQDINKRHKQPINESNTKKKVTKLKGIKITK